MNLSQIDCFAIAVMIHAARQPNPFSVRRLPGADAFPEAFPPIIVKALINSGLLISEPRMKAVMIAKPPESITVLHVVEAIEGPISARAKLPQGLNPYAEGKLANLMKETADATRRILSSVTIADLYNAQADEDSCTKS